jgi:hypothetical protein
MRTNSGLRSTAKSIATLVAAALLLTLSACAPTTQNPKTAEFLQSKFSAAGVEGFTPGQVDYGFTLEALTQLWAVGATDDEDVAAAAASLWASTDVTDKTSYLFDQTNGSLKAGLAGKALVFGKLYGQKGSDTFSALVDELLLAVTAGGKIVGADGNVFDYGWVTLGLKTAQLQQSNLVAVNLALLAREDGGFGADQSENTTGSSADATGMALMALAATKGNGTAAQETSKDGAIAAAKSWLTKNTVELNHFESWGDIDVNSTAYAIMGLRASGEDTSAYQEWLSERVIADGGIASAWSEGAGDTFATIQGLLALDGRSYNELLG